MYIHIYVIFELLQIEYKLYRILVLSKYLKLYNRGYTHGKNDA